MSDGIPASFQRTLIRPLTDKLKLLLVDLRAAPEESDAAIGLDDFFQIQICGRSEQLDEQMVSDAPQVICFEFDYPDRAGMQLIQAIKENYPSLPMIMTTLQHSEELAVWAFRSRLADYLVKPVPRSELERCHGMLIQMCQGKKGQGSRKMAQQTLQVPPEISTLPRAVDRVLQPAVYYVAKNFRRKIQNQEVADLCAMSPFNFSRAFKDAFGISFRDYVVRYRLREACRLLNNPNVTITDVAYAVGFNDVSYFSRMFKRYLGMSPSSRIKGEPHVLRDQSPTAELRIPQNLVGKEVH